MGMSIEEIDDAKLIIAEHGMKLTKEKCADTPFTISLAIALMTMDEYERLKANYENRLKADMVAMLTELWLEIEEKKFLESSCSFMDKTEEKNYAVYTDDISNIIQQKIDALRKVVKDGK